MSKKLTSKEKFYIPIVSFIKTSTNLTNLQNKLFPNDKNAKQKLNYYIRELVKRNILIQKGKGWYEVVKDLTNYDNFLDKDYIRGHAYVWEIKLPKEIEGWKDRIEILTKKGIHFKLVGAKLDTPRIKVLERKVWLCKDHLRVFDKKASSYYGKDARESRSMSLQQIKLITGVLEKRLGIVIRPSDIYFRKEHYALIKNDLAIESNRRGEIIRISDEDGEWLLIDDSLEKGGELENVGKKAFQTNIPMQNWWNDNKKTNFQVTPSFLMEALNKVAQNQQVESEKWGFYAKNIESHTKAIIQLSKKMGQLVDIKKENVKLNKKQQTKLNKWF